MESARWVLRWAKRQKLRMAASVFLHILGVGLLMAEPFIFKSIVDDVLRPGKYDELLPLLGASLFFAIFFLVVKYTNNIFWEITSQEIVQKLRSELFRRIVAQTSRFYRENAAGDLITKCTGDVDIVRHFICWVIPNAFESVLLVATVLVVFVSVNPLYALCLFILTPTTIVLGALMGRKLRPAHGRVREARSRLSTVVNENISGNRVVKAFTREDFEMEKFEAENQGFRDAQLDANKIWLRYAPFIESVAHVLGAVNLVVGGLMVVHGFITLGEMTIFLSLAWALNMPLNNMSALINDSQRFLSSCEKLQNLYYAPNDIQSPEKPAAVKETKGAISFRNVSLNLGGISILENINLDIAPGQTIGFMGPTGSGKTMLASLIPRFADVTMGTVSVDGIDVRRYALPQLRAAIGMTMQDVFLFSSSVENNVAYGEPEASMERIREACVTADADGFVSRFADGYETIVGERGTGISGGQKQRLSLARAILPQPKILILDDTTSAVDMETEKYIQSRLRALPGSATTLIIAQRVSSIAHADRIYILQNGRIAEQGNHAQLMENRGYYYETCMLQQGAVMRPGDASAERGRKHGGQTQYL